MPSFRKVVLANEQVYHVYNRGVERRTIFTNKREFQRAIDTINYYRFKQLPYKFSRYIRQPEDIKKEFIKKFALSENKRVEILAFCLMPNHFHFLVRQLQDEGISTFVSHFTNSYTKYFNTKHERVGPLVQGVFQAVYVESDEQLVHLSRYIHLNPVVAFICKEEDFEHYEWSSIREYLQLTSGFCDTKSIMDHFLSPDEYKNFIRDQISYAKELNKIKHLMLE